MISGHFALVPYARPVSQAEHKLLKGSYSDGARLYKIYLEQMAKAQVFDRVGNEENSQIIVQIRIFDQRPSSKKLYKSMVDWIGQVVEYNVAQKQQDECRMVRDIQKREERNQIFSDPAMVERLQEADKIMLQARGPEELDVELEVISQYWDMIGESSRGGVIHSWVLEEVETFVDRANESMDLYIQDIPAKHFNQGRIKTHVLAMVTILMRGYDEFVESHKRSVMGRYTSFMVNQVGMSCIRAHIRRRIQDKEMEAFGWSSNVAGRYLPINLYDKEVLKRFNREGELTFVNPCNREALQLDTDTKIRAFGRFL